MTFSLRARSVSTSIRGVSNSTPQSAISCVSLIDAGDVQQGLRGNAALEQAGAAEPRVGLDERDFHAHVGGHERGRVTAGPAAQHHQLSLHRRFRPSY